MRHGLWSALPERIAPFGGRLGEAERRIVEAAADAFFPPGETMPRTGSEAGLARYLEELLALSRPTEQLLMHLLLHFTEWSPLAFGPERRPFTRLSAASRLAHLDAAFHSRSYLRRIAFTSLRALVTMGYLAHPAIAQRIGIVHDTDPFGLGSREGGTP